MRKSILALATVLFCSNLLAQAPQLMSYQAVVRNGNNQLLSNAPVGMRISVLQGSANGNAAYSETHSVTTNAQGLATLSIGGGTPQSGTFAGINWANDPYFLKAETDPAGGSNYSIIATSQLMSVPYALYAASAGKIPIEGISNVPSNLPNGELKIYNCNGKAQFAPCVPTVTTNPVNQLTNTTAVASGTVTADGGVPVLSRGLCWSSTPNPTINDNKTTEGGGLGTFSSSMLNLTPNTTYYLRAFATNVGGVGYGNEISFTTLTSNFISDADGNIYTSVIIGTQEWMAQNLKTSKYNNGDPIPTISDPILWSNSSAGAICTFNNNPSNKSVYGYLYNWFAANDTRKICPVNWHVPTSQDWSTLTNFLGGQNIAGGKLKSTSFWSAPNVGANDQYGFNAIPNGWRDFDGTYYYLGTVGVLMCSTPEDRYLSLPAYSRAMDNQSTNLGIIWQSSNIAGATTQKWGAAVRCIKD